MILRFLLIFILNILLFTPAQAESPPRHSQARLLSAVMGVDKLETVQAAVEVKLDAGWKTYWRTPGEAGLAPVFDWAGSSNFKSAHVRWPAPVRFTAFDIDNYGYEGTVIFPVDVTVEEPGKPLTLNLKLDLLICEELCIPESHKISLTIPARESILSEDQPLIAAAAAKIPANLSAENFSIHNIWLTQESGNKVSLHVNARSAQGFDSASDMFVESSPFVSIGRPDVAFDAGTQELQLTSPVRSAESMEELQKKLSRAPLTLTFTTASVAFESRFPLNGGAAQESLPDIVSFAAQHIDAGILLLAFLGGLILNLMPCVLPVLSLKILSVLSHGGKDHRIHRWTVFRNFMASAAGILFSFWVMAGILAAFKSAGHNLGWGIQFQHPAFLIFLIVTLALFAVNMWGLYEIPLPRFIARNIPAEHAHEPTLAGHFLTGAFATLLATPCTAPFLGTAVGFALAGQAADIFIVFTFLGLGLAFPYIILSLSPRIFKYMPKPGRWMLAFKKMMALALALTAVWLASVLLTVTTQPTLDTGWTKFNEALIKPAVDEGQTVIVDITADWCLTCKANKRLVLDQKDVADALFGPNILRLQADWTQRDDSIAAYMRKYGRYGVPFNIVYGPGAPNGIILSELLSRDEVMNALTEAAGE